MAISFLRLVYITTFDPPYVPLGSSAPPAHRHRISSRGIGKARTLESGIALGEYDTGDDSRGTAADAKARNDPDSPGLELFYTKDVFTCEVDGRPSWCSSCANWKPDRAHHCSSSGRCITKMDHYCPWVGGPIGETNFKYFIQFNGYATLYCIHLLVVMAIYVRQQIINQV
jgi:palmitoyltransferase